MGKLETEKNILVMENEIDYWEEKLKYYGMIENVKENLVKYAERKLIDLKSIKTDLEKLYKLENHVEELTLLIKTFGDKQLIVAIEELSELQKELCKCLRGNLNKDHVIEEVADVLIMVEQIKIYFNIKDEELEEYKTKKIERTMKLLKKEGIQ